MDIRDQITVNNFSIRLQPYTELRHRELKKVDERVDKWFDTQDQNLRFSELDRSKKAEFWMARAEILWEPQPRYNENGEVVDLNDDPILPEYWDEKKKFFTKKFFEDPAFEYSLLKRSQDFFLMNVVFL